MSETRRLRDLGEGDLSWIADREVDIFGPAAWSRELIDEDFRSGLRRYRGVEEVGVLVGYVVYGLDGGAFHLFNLAVVPEARGRGHARALVEDFLGEARRLGAREASLEVAVTNDAAVGLYKRYGFGVVRVRQRYYQPEDVDALVLGLDLRET